MKSGHEAVIWLIKVPTLSHSPRPPIVCGIFGALRVWMAGDRYDVATLEQALGRLGPALEILDGFTYRNKNQHRLSKWWAQLDMLRRGTRKLSLDLQDSIRDRPSQVKKRKKRAVAKGADQKLDLRARHLRVQIVPRSYLYVCGRAVAHGRGPGMKGMVENPKANQPVEPSPNLPRTTSTHSSGWHC